MSEYNTSGPELRIAVLERALDKACEERATMADTLRRAQARGTELLERARAAEAKLAQVTQAASEIAEGLRTSFMHRGEAERMLRQMAKELATDPPQSRDDPSAG